MLRDLGWTGNFVRPPYDARLNLIDMNSLVDRRTMAACMFMRSALTDLTIISVEPPAITFLANRTRSAARGLLRQLPVGRTLYQQNSPLRRCIAAFNDHSFACSQDVNQHTVKVRLRKDFLQMRRLRLTAKGYLNSS